MPALSKSGQILNGLINCDVFNKTSTVISIKDTNEIPFDVANCSFKALIVPSLNESNFNICATVKVELNPI